MSAIIALIANERQYSVVCRQYPEAIIATNDSSVYFAAMMDGRTAIDLWGCLSEREIRDIRVWSIDVCRSIGSSGHPSFWCGKRNLVALAQFALRYPLMTIRLGTLAFSRILRKMSPAAVVVFSESVQVNHEVSTTSSADVFNVTARLVAAQSGMPVTMLHLTDEKQLPSRVVNSLDQSPTIEPLDLDSFVRIDGLCVANDNCVREQAKLNEFLARRGPVQDWLVVGTQPPQQQIPYLPIKAMLWLADSPEDRAAVDPSAIKQDVLAVMDRDIARIMHLDDPCFDFIWSDLAVVCRVSFAWYRTGQLLSRLFNPQKIITGYDIYAAGRNFTAGLVDGGGEVFSIDHGTLIMDEFTYQYESGESMLVVRGEVDRQHLARVRGGEDHVFAAGCLRDDHLKPQNRIVGHDAHEIILLTGKTTSGGDFSGWTGCETLASAWMEVKRLAAENPQWQFIVKCHPRSDTTLFYRYLVSGIANMRVESEQNSELYQHAIAAVMMNNATTSSLNAMELGVPVIYLQNAMFDWTTSPFDREVSIPKCRSISALREELTRLSRDDAYREELVYGQKRFYGSVFSRLGLDAARSLIDRAESCKAWKSYGARNPADMASVVVVSIAHAYLAGSITLRYAANKLAALRRYVRSIDHVSRSHAAVFRYIVWSDDTNASRRGRLLFLLAAWVVMRSFMAKTGFALFPHIVALVKPSR
jgi:hypothetical protein